MPLVGHLNVDFWSKSQRWKPQNRGRHDKGRWTKIHKALQEHDIPVRKAVNTSQGVKVYPSNISSHRELTRQLDKSEIEFTTFQVSEDRDLSVVLRGVNESSSDQEILDELRVKFPSVKSVHRMRRGDNIFPLVVVRLDSKSPQSKSIFDLTRLGGLCITVEKPRKSKDLNPDKTQAILIRKNRRSPDGNLKMKSVQMERGRSRQEEKTVQWKDHCKYLGVIVDKTLRWKPHIDAQVQKSKMARSKLRPLLGRRSKLSIRNKMMLISMVLLPIMTYASAAWGYAAKTWKKKLQAQHSIAIREAVNAPWYIPNRMLYEDLRQVSILETMQTNAVKFFRNSERHEKPPHSRGG
nr:unnamed protein product [Callosobruchus chinensis]